MKKFIQNFRVPLCLHVDSARDYRAVDYGDVCKDPAVAVVELGRVLIESGGRTQTHGSWDVAVVVPDCPYPLYVLEHQKDLCVQDVPSCRNHLWAHRALLNLLSLVRRNTHAHLEHLGNRPRQPSIPGSPLSPFRAKSKGKVTPGSPTSPTRPSKPSMPLQPASPVGPRGPGGPVGPERPGLPDMPCSPLRPS
uniref:Uncharacterized protein n=1 Tax=Glossina palpalis gambiensis TaxID=67801 RepID=A0A1B0AUK3_9MUSC